MATIQISEKDLRDPRFKRLRDAVKAAGGLDDENDEVVDKEEFGDRLVPRELTLSERIESITFVKQFSGYSKEQVDAFLDDVGRHVEKMEKEIRRLRRRLGR